MIATSVQALGSLEIHARRSSSFHGSVHCCRFFSFWCLLFLTHQLAIALFRLIGTIGRTLVVAYTLAWLVFLLVLLLNGFVLVKSSIPVWFIGGYWALPMSYLQNAIEINEFTGGELIS